MQENIKANLENIWILLFKQMHSDRIVVEKWNKKESFCIDTQQLKMESIFVNNERVREYY